MELARLKFVHRVVLPVLLIAIGFVAYYSFQTAAQFARLGERSIANSTLWLARDKVNRLEEQIIQVDNAIFNSLDLSHPRRLGEPWKTDEGEAIGGVRELAILDSQQHLLAFSSRAGKAGRQRFRSLLQNRIIADLNLNNVAVNRLYHLHKRYDNRSYLISYKAVEYDGQGYFLIAHHDTGYLLREVFPTMFTSDSGKEWINVVDENNNRIFGESLNRAGDYVVGHRFPTTLYGWRLQVAPTAAPLLEAKGRTSRVNQGLLIALCLAVIFAAVVFSLYVASQERRLASLKSDFIANVSHELKTPLSVIRMFAEMLSTNRVSDPQKRQDYLDIMSRESERLSSLIQNVLDFAALERGKQQYELEIRDLDVVVERALETFRYRLDQIGVRAKLISEGGPHLCRVDEQSILLSVINLLDNAVKYGRGSEITVAVEGSEHEVTLSVRDRGPGIADGDLKRVFERFYRTARRSGVRGSGIGLSLVKHIAMAHGGRAWAEQAPGGGARIAIAIPRAQEVDASASEFLEASGSAATVHSRHA